MYEYAARVVRVIDGDTLVLDIDLGLDVHHVATVRIFGINAPELSTAEGVAARSFVANLVTERGEQVVVRTTKDRREKYGRYLADISWPDVDGASLSYLLVQTRNAVPYRGK